jgi:hypothetical protein
MTATCKRLVIFAGSTMNPLDPGDTQVALVQGVAGVSLDPQRIQLGAGPFVPASDFFDCLVDPTFDKTPYVTLYEAALQDTGEIVVKRDLFGKDDFGHTWSGWPVPGDPPPVPADPNAPVPTTPVLTKKEREALQVVYAHRKARNGKTTR